MGPKTLYSLVIETFNEWSEDKVPRLGAALAYYSVFSIAPLLIIVISAASFFFGKEAAQKGVVGDTTPPPTPTHLIANRIGDTQVELTWDAQADLESGLAGFVIERDGKPLGQLPEKPVGKFGRPLFQGLSYHDTPEKCAAEMRYTDAQIKAGETHEYRVIAINSVGLKSEPSAAAQAK